MDQLEVIVNLFLFTRIFHLTILELRKEFCTETIFEKFPENIQK